MRNWDNEQGKTVRFFPYPIVSKYNLKDLQYRYKIAEDVKKEIGELLEYIEEYQRDILTQVQKAMEIRYKPFIEFKREELYKGGINYHVRVINEPQDVKNYISSDVTIYKKTYKGRERHLAIKDVKRLVKKYANSIEIRETGVNKFT